jgi:hypothetical protein
MMKNFLSIAVLGALVFPVVVGAQQQPADPHGDDAKSGATSAPPSVEAQTPSGKAVHEMDEHMQRMQSLHERMLKASSREERRKLMLEARKEMQAGMSMMGSGMHGSSSTPAKGGMPENPRLDNLERRMDMMQMMMQMMMDEQRMGAESMRGAGPAK